MKKNVAIILLSSFLLCGCFGKNTDGGSTQSYRSRYQGKIERFNLDRISLRKDIFGEDSHKSKSRAIIKTDTFGNELESKTINDEEYYCASSIATPANMQFTSIDMVEQDMNAWINANKERYLDVGKTLDDLGIVPNKFYYYDIPEQAKREKEKPSIQYQMYQATLSEGKKADKVTFYLLDEFDDGDFGFCIDTLEVLEDGKLSVSDLTCNYSRPWCQVNEEPPYQDEEHWLKTYFYFEVVEGSMFRSYKLNVIPDDIKDICSDDSNFSYAVKGDDGNWKIFTQSLRNRSLSLQDGDLFYTLTDEDNSLSGTYFRSASVLDLSNNSMIYRVNDPVVDFDLSAFSGYTRIGAKADDFYTFYDSEPDLTIYQTDSAIVFNDQDKNIFENFKINFDENSYAYVGQGVKEDCVQLGESVSCIYDMENRFDRAEERLVSSGTFHCIEKIKQGEGPEDFMYENGSYDRTKLSTLLNAMPLTFKNESIKKDNLIDTLCDFYCSSFNEVSTKYVIKNVKGEFGDCLSSVEEFFGEFAKESMVKALKDEVGVEKFPDINELLPLEPIPEGLIVEQPTEE